MCLNDALPTAIDTYALALTNLFITQDLPAKTPQPRSQSHTNDLSPSEALLSVFADHRMEASELVCTGYGVPARLKTSL